MGTVIILKWEKGSWRNRTEGIKSLYYTEQENFDFYDEYYAYLVKIYLNAGFPAYYGWARVQFVEQKVGEKVPMKRRIKAFNIANKKELSMIYFIEEILGAKKINYTEGYL
jgi:hypothetical protein